MTFVFRATGEWYGALALYIVLPLVVTLSMWAHWRKAMAVAVRRVREPEAIMAAERETRAFLVRRRRVVVTNTVAAIIAINGMILWGTAGYDRGPDDSVYTIAEGFGYHNGETRPLVVGNTPQRADPAHAPFRLVTSPLIVPTTTYYGAVVPAIMLMVDTPHGAEPLPIPVSALHFQHDDPQAAPTIAIWLKNDPIQTGATITSVTTPCQYVVADFLVECYRELRSYTVRLSKKVEDAGLANAIEYNLDRVVLVLPSGVYDSLFGSQPLPATSPAPN